MIRTKRITIQDIISLSNRPEGHFFDKKAKEVSGRNIQKLAVAFANADGGDIIIGITDEKDEPNPEKRWNGGRNQECFNFVFQSLLEITPSLAYSAHFLQHPTNDTYALQITIEKSNKVHSCPDQSIFIRQSAQSIPIKDPQQILELSFAKGERSYEDFIFKEGKAEDIFESNEMQTFLQNVSPSSDPIDFTINQNLIDRTTFEPRIAGILIFNDNPVTLLPRKCGIKITRYDTNELIPEREHLKRQISIEGCLYKQIHQAIDCITEIMSSVSIYTTQGLQKVAYPPETIWEILVNAVIHRDYSISDDIQVLIYNNRIEIISPGKLPGYVTIDNILDARFSRNTRIVRTLNRYQNPPNKDMGEGLNTAFQKMHEWKLARPQIKEIGNYVHVIIAHNPLASPDEAVLQYLEKNELITNGVARNLTGTRSENAMKAVFYKLRDQELIEPIKSPKGNKTIAWKLKA